MVEILEDNDIAVKPVIEVSNEVKEQLLSKVEEEGQVTIHCKVVAEAFPILYRIWDSTYLIDKQSKHRSSLLFSEGITRYPYWTPVPPNTTTYFTLIFSALPKSCKVFDFFEQIPEPGGFYKSNIARTSTDVYHVDLTD